MSSNSKVPSALPLICEQEVLTALPLPLLQGGPIVAQTELPRGGVERRSVIILLQTAAAKPLAKQEAQRGKRGYRDSQLTSFSIHSNLFL